jgi:hypothetical protein
MEIEIDGRRVMRQALATSGACFWVTTGQGQRQPRLICEVAADALDAS